MVGESHAPPGLLAAVAQPERYIRFKVIMLYTHLSNAVCSIIELFFPGRQKIGGSIPFYTI